MNACREGLKRIVAAAMAGAMLGLFATAASTPVGATTYYVDPAGNNANDGLSPQSPWRTLLKVGLSTLAPGDVVLFKRDGVWNEWLTPPSSGAPGQLIKFDAYGTGRPPRFTGLYPTTDAQWTNTSGNVWQSTLSSAQGISQLKFVQFGTLWGNMQSTSATLIHERDWYYDPAAQTLYVYSLGNPITAYGSVDPIICSGQSLINLNGTSYLEIQHIALDWYDGYGVQLQGASDHIWLANISADSQVPNSTIPIGFFIHPSGMSDDIHIYNTDAHRNYVGYRFDGPSTATELKNCRAYANRTFGLVDNTAAVNYSFCHFYGNNIATGTSTDISGTPGPIDGGNNVPADTAPNIRDFLRYPARITVTFDDPGLIDGPHEYIQSLLPIFQRKALPLSIAIVSGYDRSQQLVPIFQSWIDAGWDLNSHSTSHQYFTFLDAFTVQYTGTAASSVRLSISNKRLTIEAPGDPDAQVVWDLGTSSTDLVPEALDTLGGLVYALNGRGVFSAVSDPNMKSAVKSGDLADVTGQDIKTSPFTLTLDKSRLMNDELGWSKAWMNANLTGLGGHRSVSVTWPPKGDVEGYNVYRSATSGNGHVKVAGPLTDPTYTDFAVNPQQTWYYKVKTVKEGMETDYSTEKSVTVPGNWVYVYPGTLEDTSTEAIAISTGYQGARGASTMRPSPNAATVLASGINVQNIVSQGMIPSFQNLTDTQFANKFRAMVFKAGVWGVPYGVFFHMNELTPHQVELMLDTLRTAGATFMSNTQLVDYLLNTKQVDETTYYADDSLRGVDFRPTAISPVVDRGATLPDEYRFDAMGIDQRQFGEGWEIGALTFVPEYLGKVR